MNVAYGPVELKKFLEEAARVSQVSDMFTALVARFPALGTGYMFSCPVSLFPRLVTATYSVSRAWLWWIFSRDLHL